MKKIDWIKTLFYLTALNFCINAQTQPDSTKGVPINTTRPEINRTDTIPRSGIKLGVEDKNAASVALRKPNKKELAAIAPNSEDLTNYSSLLAKNNTGLIRLMPDIGCDTNKNVVDVSNKCSVYTLPGNGSSFSFRLGRYVGNYFADIKLKSNFFISSGNLNLGFFVMLGNTPLENISLDTEGAKFLFDFIPPKDASEANTAFNKFATGIAMKDYTYKNTVPAMENTTYLFRAIAYREESAPKSLQNMDFNDIEIDKRKDVVVAFRVIRKDSDGSYSLIWRELQRKDSPKLEKSR